MNLSIKNNSWTYSSYYKKEFGYFILIFFALFRPLTLILGNYRFYGFNVLEVFPVVIFYLSLVAILSNAKFIKVNLIFISVTMFIFYCILSALWGSEYKDIARKITPFLLIFLVASSVKSEAQIKVLLIAIVIGYIYPILGSMYAIILDIDKGYLVYHTGDIRSIGIFLNTHSLGHSMLFFIFIYYLLRFYYTIISKFFRVMLDLLFICSLYCFYKAGTRTTYVGFLIFLSIILWRNHKIYLLLFLTMLIIVVIFRYDKISSVIWQTSDIRRQSLDSASSGRLSIWRHDINTYIDFSIDKKLLGSGLGSENSPFLLKKEPIISAHNDYLSLLLTLGVVGFLSYVFIYCVLFTDIFFFKSNVLIRTYAMGTFLSVVVMNGLSNSYISRVELAQGIFFIYGVFYCYKWRVLR